jgi:hypothetical protein
MGFGLIKKDEGYYYEKFSHFEANKILYKSLALIKHASIEEIFYKIYDS